MEQQHTPEPWISEGSFIGIPNGKSTFYMVPMSGINQDWRESDARRIVACVNACAGVPTDQLESVSGKLAISSSVSMWQSYCDKKMHLEDAIEQRDKLLTSIEQARLFLTSGTHGERKAERILNAAIAGVKGGAA